jgi:hypothetical protein
MSRYRLAVPAARYSPWFATPLKACRLAVRALQLLQGESRASKLSFADVVKRLAATDEADPTFVSKKARAQRTAHSAVHITSRNGHAWRTEHSAAHGTASHGAYRGIGKCPVPRVRRRAAAGCSERPGALLRFLPALPQPPACLCLPACLPACISTAPPRAAQADVVERFVVVHGQLFLNQFSNYPVESVRRSAFVSTLKERMQVGQAGREIVGLWALVCVWLVRVCVWMMCL